MKRINSIDFVRGLVMIIMALDHTRDFFHVSSLTQNPVDPSSTSVPLFFTRWITHLCAPTFVFLSGLSAYLSFKQDQQVSTSRRFLIGRGLWLILLEFTLVNFGVWFDPHFSNFLFDVIACIGVGFILLSLLLSLQPKTIGLLGLLIIVCHALVASIPFPPASFLTSILSPFFVPGAFPLGANINFIMGYPPIPWLGIMLTGFGAGPLFELTPMHRRKYFLGVGLGAIFLFLVLRMLNGYGDPASWSHQSNTSRTILSFLNVSKYPPSLLFSLLTLGTMMLLFWLAEPLKNKFTDCVMVYGKVPLFYFLVHWYILHPLLFLVLWLQGYRSTDFVFGFNFGRPVKPSGLSLWGVYAIWIGLVMLMYPLCKWYGRYKARHRQNKLLRYL